MDILIYIIIIALGSAFTIIVLDKWGIREWLQVHGSRLISKMAGCTFCLGFWIAVILSIFLSAISGECSYLLIPIFSSPITRFIL